MAGGCVNIVDGNGWGFAVNGTSEVFPKTFSCQRPVASAKTQAQNGTSVRRCFQPWLIQINTYVICFAKFCQALPPGIGDEKGAHVDSLQQLELCEAALKAIQLWQWCGSTCLG